MEDSVLFSIRPRWCELISNGVKTCEIRKTAPTLTPPYTGYIYETRGFERVGNDNLNCVVGGEGRGKVIGEFRVIRHTFIQTGTDPDGTRHLYNTAFIGRTCLTYYAIFDYLQSGKGSGWALDFQAVKIYRTPKLLTDFVKPPCKKATGCAGCKDWDGVKHVCRRDAVIKRPPQSWCYVWPAPF